MADDSAKEWVNIRIPETVRDDAREDPRTYGEIMRAGLGVDADDVELGPGYEEIGDKIAASVAKRLEESKPLEEMAFEDWFEPDYASTIARHVTAEMLEGDLAEQLDAIESAATTPEKRTGTIESTLEEMGAGR